MIPPKSKSKSPSTISIQVRYQPNWNQTLDDPGIRQVNLRVTSHQYWGMLLMAYALFGGSDSRIQFQERSINSTSGWRSMKLAYLNSMIGPYVLAQDPIYQPVRPINNWTEYLESFKQNRSFNPMDFTEYMGHFIGRSEVMVRFSNLEFLQGAILVCFWFDLRISDYIHNLRHNWQPFRILLTEPLTSVDSISQPLLSTEFIQESTDLLDEPSKPSDNGTLQNPENSVE